MWQRCIEDGRVRQHVALTVPPNYTALNCACIRAVTVSRTLSSQGINFTALTVRPHSADGQPLRPYSIRRSIGRLISQSGNGFQWCEQELWFLTTDTDYGSCVRIQEYGATSQLMGPYYRRYCAVQCSTRASAFCTECASSHLEELK